MDPKRQQADRKAMKAPANTLGVEALSTQPSGTWAGGVPDLPIEFGRYRLLKQLGVGGMGTVYLAQDMLLDRKVALKLPHFSIANKTQADRFRREAKLSAILDHPNICRIFDIGEHQGRLFLTMAYVEGHTLHDILQSRGALDSRAAASLLRGVAKVVQFAHSQGVIHRDLKPANIMIKKNKDFVIMDFGLARRFEQEDEQITATGAVLGTPAYMAPEQLRGESGSIGPQSDVYSLGIILFELLTGRRPFQGTLPEIYTQVLTSDSVAPSMLEGKISLELCAICRTATQSKVAARFKSAAEFEAALGNFLSGNSAPTMPVAPSIRLPAPSEAARERTSIEPSAISNSTETSRKVGLKKLRVPPVFAGLSVAALGLVVLVGAVMLGRKFRGDDSQLDFNQLVASLSPLSQLSTEPPPLEQSDAESLDEATQPVEQTASEPSDSSDSSANSAAAKDTESNLASTDASATSPDIPSAFMEAPDVNKGPLNNDRQSKVDAQSSRFRDDNSLRMRLVWIPPGSFQAGSPASEAGRDKDETQMSVTLTRGFWLGQTEITQRQWKTVMGSAPWDEDPAAINGDDYPATHLLWAECMVFAKRLNEREGSKLPIGFEYALPTEAQWEYACRAGSQSRFHFGDNPGQIKAYSNCAYSLTHAQEVGKRMPNSFDLYDMHGNVSEWCSDVYSADPPSGNDPIVTKGGAHRVLRGGDWSQPAANCRSAERSEGPNDRAGTIGFRIALVPIATVQSNSAIVNNSASPSKPTASAPPKPAQQSKPATIAIDAASKPKLDTLIANSRVAFVRSDLFNKNIPFTKLNAPYVENGASAIKSDSGVWGYNFSSLAEGQLCYTKVRVREKTGSVAVFLTTTSGHGLATWVDGEGIVTIGPSIFANEKDKQSMQSTRYSIANNVHPADQWNEVVFLRSRGSVSVFINKVMVDTVDLNTQINSNATLSFGIGSIAAGTVAELDTFEIYQVQ